jgi:serine/threonine protein kinase
LDPENSPTVTLGATVAGTVMGTAAYMAPEQAKGKRVDKRADIWSWGVVLYELLTGERLFKGDEATDTLAQVLTKEPDWDRASVRVQLLLQRCLEKDPKKRLRDIGEALRGRLQRILAFCAHVAARHAMELGVDQRRQTIEGGPVAPSLQRHADLLRVGGRHKKLPKTL